MRLDGEELRAQGGHFGGGEAGAEEAVETLGGWRCAGCMGVGAGGETTGSVGLRVLGLRGGQEGCGGEGFGAELRGRELGVGGDGAVDVELGGGFAGRGEAERGVEGGGWGEEGAGVDEAEGGGGEGGG